MSICILIFLQIILFYIQLDDKNSDKDLGEKIDEHCYRFIGTLPEDTLSFS